MLSWNGFNVICVCVLKNKAYDNVNSLCNRLSNVVAYVVQVEDCRTLIDKNLTYHLGSYKNQAIKNLKGFQIQNEIKQTTLKPTRLLKLGV